MALAEMEKKYDVSADRYYAAVSRYENYPKFVEGVKSVRVKREGPKIHGDYEVSLLGKDLSYALNISEDPAKKTVSWTLDHSEFFKVNNGTWEIASAGPSACTVKYRLEIDLSFSVPQFILKGAIKTSLPAMMNSFYEEAKKS